jgi:hypothetical protein
MFKLISLCLTLSLSLFIASCSSGDTAEQQFANTSSYITMQENTPIAVTLSEAIDTDVNVSGDEFLAVLRRAVVVDGHTLFADGARARGILNNVVESGRLKTPAELDFSLTAIQDDSGRWIKVATHMISENKASHTNREVAMIGGGAIVGGIIGKIINRDGSTEIGAAAGAAAGTGLAIATGKQDIYHGAGTEVTFFSSGSSRVAL